MKRLTTIALFIALAAFAACNKDSKKNEPAKTETVPGTAAGSAAAAGQAAAAGTIAAADQAAAAAAAAGTAAAAAGTQAAIAGQGAAGTAAAAELSDSQVEAIGGRMMTLMESVADAVAANATDCNAMANAVDKVLTANQTALAEMKAAAGGGTNDAKFEAWMDKNKGRAEALTSKLGPGMTKCAGEARLQEAFSKLDI